MGLFREKEKKEVTREKEQTERNKSGFGVGTQEAPLLLLQCYSLEGKGPKAESNPFHLSHETLLAPL